MLIEELGARIRKRREERGLKQADIAAGLTVSAQAVSKWERGENAPDIALLPKLSSLLDVSVDWLLGLTEGGREVFEATVFVSAMEGFAKKSVTMPPAEVAAWANGFFYHLTEAALKHDGVPVKQTGDGLLAFFTGPNHQGRAVLAAERAAKTIGPGLQVALASGLIYLGALGHPDYQAPDITGSAVNEAFLVLAESVGPIVMTGPVAEALDGGPSLAAPVKRKIALLEKEVALYAIAEK